MEQFRHVELVQTVHTTPAEAYRGFVNAVLLRDWFCDTAYTVPRIGGQYLLSWNSGYYATGEYLTLEEKAYIKMTWQGRNDPAPTLLEIDFAPSSLLELATHITLRHGKIPTISEEWDRIFSEIQKGWEIGLENFVSVLEQGIDLRVARRPMIGIYLDEFNAQIATRLGVPVTEGMRLSGVLPDLGAAKAGLQADDVIISLNGKPIPDYHFFTEILKPFQAGDTVELQVYRGPNLLNLSLTLSPRPKPEHPSTSAALVERVRKDYATANLELEEALQTITPEAAEKKPTPNDWSAKETLAHLIASERDFHAWLASMLNDNFIADSLDYSSNVHSRMAALVAVYNSLPELLTVLKSNQQETLEFLARLPVEFVARKHYFYRISEWTRYLLDHYRDHIEQIKAAAG